MRKRFERGQVSSLRFARARCWSLRSRNLRQSWSATRCQAPTAWRYARASPARGNPCALGEGMTSLIRTPRLGGESRGTIYGSRTG